MDPLDLVPAFALLGGAALYLMGHVAFRYRHVHTINRQRVLLSVVLLAMLPAAVEVSALAVLAVMSALLWLLIGYETRRYGERRTQLRHQPPDPVEPS